MVNETCMICAILVPSLSAIGKMKTQKICYARLHTHNRICFSKIRSTFSILLRCNAYLSCARNCINLIFELWDSSVILLMLGKNLYKKKNQNKTKTKRKSNQLDGIAIEIKITITITTLTWTYFVRQQLCYNRRGCLLRPNSIVLCWQRQHFRPVWCRRVVNRPGNQLSQASNKPMENKRWHPRNQLWVVFPAIKWSDLMMFSI